jgi:hypothetical protein
MHVLKRVHHWLRPGGRVIDIHPEPERCAPRSSGWHWPDVRRAVGSTPYARPAIYENVRRARDTPARLVAEGLFSRERSAVFEVLYHFESVDAWLSYRLERGTSTEVDPSLLAHAREVLADRSGELLIREQMLGARHRASSANRLKVRSKDGLHHRQRAAGGVERTPRSSPEKRSAAFDIRPQSAILINNSLE